jgi:ELWxxDGT repeat protein
MNRFVRSLVALAALAVAPPLAAQTAYLVKDIAPGRQEPSGSDPGSMWSFQGKVIFSAQEPSSGRELWITDGNSSGTRLLADFCSGRCSSAPLPLGTAHSLLFGISFPNADEGFSESGNLWRSDGTRQGTFLLPDPLDPLVLSFLPDDGEPVDGPRVQIVFGTDAVYFAACNQQSQCGVWRTDGTAAGTVKLNDFGSGSASELTLVGNRLFFTGNQQELWTSDGTPAGTTRVRQFTNGSPRHLAALGNKVLFLAPADAPGSGEELWVSDGTAAGTIALTSFEAPDPFQQTRFLKTLGDRVYFVADDVTHGAEIYSSDGTAAGTVRITDFGFFNPFGWDSDIEEGGLAPAQIARLGNRLVFWATDGLHQYQPWSNLGTFASTTSLCSSCAFGQNGIFQPLNGGLVFVAGAADSSLNELWASDGTQQGTQMLGTTCFDCGNELVQAGAAVYFRGPSPDQTGKLRAALWASDGTPAGTRLFAAAEPGFFDSLAVASLGGRILFSAWTGIASDFEHEDIELWSSDGSPGGTRLAADINRAGNSSNVAQLVAAGGHVFFTASANDGATVNVWRSDGTEPGTLQSPNPSFESFNARLFGGDTGFLVAQSFSFFGDQVWRVQNDGQTQQLTSFDDGQSIVSVASSRGQLYFLHGQNELWASDGTAQGTRKAVAVPGTTSLAFLEVQGSELWFLAAGTGSFGLSQVWQTDGTQAGTRLVHDFGSYRTELDPEFTQIGSQVYFIADRPGSDDFDYQVWRTDGTDAGTLQITDLPGVNVVRGQLAELTAFQGNLYFFANLPDGSRALWRSDGTPGGTTVVRQFPAQPGSDFFDTPNFGLTVLGSHLVFAVEDGTHGREPWSSDGTPGGTALLRDVFPGPAGSGVTSFAAAAGQLYFAADDGAHGYELWRTDGTPGGTRLMQDLAPEGASSYPAGFTVAGDKLYFSADDGTSGIELWALPLSGAACQPNAATLCLNAGRFAVTAHWRTPDGNEGAGTAVPLSADTGYFWFFGPANVEAILKVLDGRSLNDHFWVFYGALSDVEYSLTVTDTQTGLARRYANVQGQFASVGDTTGFGPLGAYDRKSVAAPSARALIAERIDPAAATGICVPAAGRLCLGNGRFAVEASWQDFASHTGTGTAVGLTGDTGYFWFFDPTNVEAVLKVLDGTAVNGHFWVYYGALSNVQYTLTVTDTMTGHVKTYQNPLGRFASAGDTLAF